MDDHPEERAYTINDIVRTFHISRSTLLYYEDLGILKSQRMGEGGYRTYRREDVLRLMSGMILKNMGVPPKELGELLDHEALSTERLDACSRAADARMEYLAAQIECFDRLRELREGVGSIAVVDVEAHYFVYDSPEDGYHATPRDQNLDLLMDHVPIGSFGAEFALDEDGVAHHRAGRSVPVRLARLIPGFTATEHVIGGCRCVRSIVFEGDRSSWAIGPDDLRADDAVQRFLDEHGLVAAGLAFSPYALPTDAGIYAPVCIPVRPA